MLCNVELHNVEVGEHDFGQLSFNLTHFAAPQADIKPRYPGPDSTVQLFCLSAAWYTMLYLKTDRGTQLTP